MKWHHLTRKLFFFIILLICFTLYTSYSSSNIELGFDSINSLFLTDSVPINKSTIFCIILTTTENLDSKAKTVYNAWANKCDNHSFISLIPNDTQSLERKEIKYKDFNLLKPAGLFSDKYDHLTNKVFNAFKDVYRNHPGYGWYLKADDDTFTFVDNLRLFIKDKNSRDPVTFGYDFRNKYVKEGYHSGGAGYLLSNQAVKKFTQYLDRGHRCLISGVEDLDVAKCLRKVKVYPKKSIDDKGRERFHPLPIDHHFKGMFPDWMPLLAINPLKKASQKFF